ncbi:MAG TPA: hypothetical protein VGF86_08185 [Candidatus Tumulicola sp.]
MNRAAWLLLTLLIGCAPHAAPQAEASRNGPPARVDVASALARHPFAAVLAQYGRDIATLRAARGSAAFRGLDSQLTGSAADVDRDLQDAAGRIGRLPPGPPSTAFVPSGAPGGQFGFDTIASFERASAQRVARALDLRAQQLREREANVAFAFDRAHAGERLVLRLKLRNLHLDAETQRAYRRRLDDLASRERALVDAQRRRAGTVLSHYGAVLRARAARDVAALEGEVAGHNDAVRTLPAPPIGGPPASLLRDRRGDAASAFSAARRDLTQRYAELRATNATARDGTTAEIAALERERETLRRGMIAQIEARARNIAASDGLGRVYTGPAPNGARDLTDAVVRSLQSAGR